MSTTLELVDPPQELPDWYPPMVQERPNEYPLRFIYLDMFFGVMIALGVAKTGKHNEAENSSYLTLEDLTTPGNWIQPSQCHPISQAFLQFASEQVPERLFLQLKQRWNEVQESFRHQVETRGEIVLDGLEDFPFQNERNLREVLLHWGAFNAIAADHNGYKVIL